ncbi:MAG: hypothetical protein K9N06_02505 [Candidatus Cloacimonetes bacterium]|nr:hypothetical protein [Candidatus Cloacimonadota bacterium]
MKLALRFFMLVMLSIILSGCLNTEFKEYYFLINDDGSGSGSITYYNLVSSEEDGVDVSEDDFARLVNNWLYGDSFELDNPDMTVTWKEIYADEVQLNGYVEFTFTDYLKIGFSRLEIADGYVLEYYLDDITETVIESNGDFYTDEDALPVVNWPVDTKELSVKTLVKKDMKGAHSLLGLYQEWLKSGKEQQD